MKIATLNINNVNRRLPNLLEWLKASRPDVACLQELKCSDADFPVDAIEAAGYAAVWRGQRTWNGVAILSRRGAPVETNAVLPGDPADKEARYIEAAVEGILVCCLYLPNGNPIDTEKYSYKLRWMDRLIAHAKKLLAYEERLVLCGDYNVIPDARDVYDPAAWVNDALFTPRTREKFRELLALGFFDALRSTTDAAKQYTFWDYQAGAWPRNNGLRIDHLLLSPQAADRLASVTIDRDMRAKDKPSDHVPIRIDLRD